MADDGAEPAKQIKSISNHHPHTISARPTDTSLPAAATSVMRDPSFLSGFSSRGCRFQRHPCWLIVVTFFALPVRPSMVIYSCATTSIVMSVRPAVLVKTSISTQAAFSKNTFLILLFVLLQHTHTNRHTLTLSHTNAHTCASTQHREHVSYTLDSFALLFFFCSQHGQTHYGGSPGQYLSL